MLASGYILSRRLRPIESTPFVYMLAGRTITAISLRNPEGAVGFVKSRGAWEMSSPAAYRVDARKLAIIEEFLTRMPFRRVMREDLANPSVFGLEHPEIEVDFKLSDGTSRELLIGNLTASKAQRYARDPSRPYVFLIDIGYVSQFEGTIASYRIKDVFDVDISLLNTIQLRRAGSVVIELVREKDEWRISRPFNAATNNIAMNKLLVSLRGLKAIDFVTDPDPDLKKLGFSPALFSLTLKDDQNRQQTLEFGRTDEHGILSMRRGRSVDIFKLLASGIDFHDYEPQELLGEAPFREKIENVRRIAIEDGGGSFVFAVDPAAHPPEYRYGDKSVNDGDFVSFYVRCINLVAIGYDPWVPNWAPAMTLVSELTDGTRKSLALYVRDEKTYYMRANDGAVQFYVSADQVDLVRERMKKVIASAE